MNKLFIVPFSLISLFGLLSIGVNLDAANPNLRFTQEIINGKVVAITDGDTFKLLTNDSIVHRIRVAYIDCPERKQPFSKRAKQFTSDAIFGKNVEVAFQSKDRYGRIIGKVRYNESFDLSEELLNQGYAWHFVKYSKDSILQGIEDTARESQIGLWQDKDAIPPWEWRTNKKTKKTTKKPTKKNQ